MSVTNTASFIADKLPQLSRDVAAVVVSCDKSRLAQVSVTRNCENLTF
jgi:hypothetical protein